MISNKHKLLALYDQHMRRESWIPGFERRNTADTARYVSHDGEQGMLMWHDFGANWSAKRTNARVQEELAWFKTKSKKLFWKLYAHDTPPNLAATLLAAGAEVEDESLLHMVDVAAVQAKTHVPAALRVHASANSADLARTNAVWNQVWPEEPEENDKWTAIYAAALDGFAAKGETPAVCFFVATASGADQPQPADCMSAGYIIHPPGSPVALLCGGSVLPQHRGQGAYGALLHARAAWAAERGVTHLATEASPMSQPIVQKLGFAPLVPMAFYKWKFAQN